MAEKSIELDSVEIAAAVFGNCDRNIRMLEKECSVTAVCRGTMLRISGEPANVAAAARAVEGMLLLIENHTPLEDQTVRYCLSLAHDGEEKRVRELTEDFVTVTVKGRPISPKRWARRNISTPSETTPSPSASARRVPARPILPLQWQSRLLRQRTSPASC